MADAPVTMFSPHARLLAHIRARPDARMRDLAAALDMTERNVQNLLRDLQGAGLVEVQRRGRRNRYRLNTRRRVGQELGLSLSLGQLLRRLDGGESAPADAPPDPEPTASPEKPSVPAAEKSRARQPVSTKSDPPEDGEQLDWLGSS